jgi:hypothetical protein
MKKVFLSILLLASSFSAEAKVTSLDIPDRCIAAVAGNVIYDQWYTNVASAQVRPCSSTQVNPVQPPGKFFELGYDALNKRIRTPSTAFSRNPYGNFVESISPYCWGINLSQVSNGRPASWPNSHNQQIIECSRIPANQTNDFLWAYDKSKNWIRSAAFPNMCVSVAPNPQWPNGVKDYIYVDNCGAPQYPNAKQRFDMPPIPNWEPSGSGVGATPTNPTASGNSGGAPSKGVFKK